MSGWRCCAASTAHSASAFEAPITVSGDTALSVDTSTNRFAPASPAAAATIRVATALLRTASIGFSSISGTCLYAAAWKTTPGRCSWNTSLIRTASRDVREHRRGAREVSLLLELAADLEQRVLGVLDQDQPPRRHARDLAAELRPDRPARAGHEHGLAGQVRADPVDLDAHGLAPQHVLDLDLAHLPDEVHAAAQQLERGRQRAHRDAAPAARRDDLLPQHARCRRDRDHDLVRAGGVQHAVEVVGRAEHLQPADPLALLARVVVDEPDRHVPELGVAPQLRDDLLPAVPAPTISTSRTSGPLKTRRAGRSTIARARKREPATNRSVSRQSIAITPRGGSVPLGEIRKSAPTRTSVVTTHRLDDRLEVALVDEAPEAVVEPERREDRDLADRR